MVYIGGKKAFHQFRQLIDVIHNVINSPDSSISADLFIGLHESPRDNKSSRERYGTTVSSSRIQLSACSRFI